jgi:hypothetical protein
MHFWPYLAQFFLEWQMFQTEVVETIKTHISCSIIFFFLNRSVYEIMRKNTVEPDRPQITIWCTLSACWIPKATNTHAANVYLLLFNCNNICMSAPHCYATGTLHVLFQLRLCELSFFLVPLQLIKVTGYSKPNKWNWGELTHAFGNHYPSHLSLTPTLVSEYVIVTCP